MKQKLLVMILTILILSFNRVNAAEYVDGQDISFYSDQALTNRLPSNGWYDYATINSTTSPNGDFTSTNFWTSPYIYTNDIHAGEITIPFYIAVPRVSTTTTSTIYGQDYCDRWTWGSIDSYNNVIRWDCSHIDQGQDNTITDREYITPQISIQAMVGYQNGYIDICRVDTNKNEIVCPIIKNSSINNIVAITIQSRVYFTSNSTYQYYVGLYRKINRFSNSTNAIIDNNNQNFNNFMETNQTYEDKLDENLEGANETGEFHLKEQELMNETRVNETWLDNLANEITINPQASAFIWDIVGGLRSMNPAIITVMTSILGLGIIKLILNR